MRRELGGVPHLAPVAFCLAVCACSWSRFDDVSKDAPIVLLKRPSVMSNGFGVTLASARSSDAIRLLVGGYPLVSGTSTFDLGLSDSPVVDAVDLGCDKSEKQCLLANNVVGLGTGVGPDKEHALCFALGIGKIPDSGSGVLVRCDDNIEYILDVPSIVATRVIEPALSSEEGEAISLAGDRDAAPAIAAGAPNHQLAWFYAPRSLSSIELRAPSAEPDSSYGKTVAVARIGNERLVAVGAPDEGHVWLFRTQGAVIAPIGCMGAQAHFGRSMTTGKISDNDNDALVIASDAIISVFDAGALAKLPAQPEHGCSLAALPAGALVTSFTCGADPESSGCNGSDFGHSLAIGDLDGDGDGEVIVGAPGMNVRDAKGAGAILVYDVEGANKYALGEVKFISSAEDGDALGTSVATPTLEGHDIIAAGAPGNAKTALFYCTRLSASADLGRRCR